MRVKVESSTASLKCAARLYSFCVIATQQCSEKRAATCLKQNWLS